MTPTEKANQIYQFASENIDPYHLLFEPSKKDIIEVLKKAAEIIIDEIIGEVKHKQHYTFNELRNDFPSYVEDWEQVRLEIIKSENNEQIRRPNHRREDHQSTVERNVRFSTGKY